MVGSKIFLELNTGSRVTDKIALFNAGISKFIEGHGVYTFINGVKSGPENSFIVPNSAKALDLARQHNQESVLIVEPNGKAKLFYLSSKVSKDLGHLVPVSKAEAVKAEAYSFFNGTYYITK